MEFEFLRPINTALLDQVQKQHPDSLGRQMRLHSAEEGLPDIDNCKIALFGVFENRRCVNDSKPEFDFDAIRGEFYKLFPGNWDIQLADLGDIEKGESVQDTYYAVQKLTNYLINRKIIPVILGGSQDLAYAQYRAYDDFGRMVNLVNVDARFDFGNTEQEINSSSYVGKMVVDEPYNLFNYANLGYQSYFNAQSEIELIDKLFFEAYRLGDIIADVKLAEPVLRDADFVSVDVNSIASESVLGSFSSPNGFNNREICAISRYAGISDKVTSFGVYHIENLDYSKNNFMLLSQILWYFIEGVNYRKNEQYIVSSKKSLITYKVPINDDILVFYKSELSGRWWIEIPFSDNVNNKLRKNTLLPCSYEDYLEACNQNIPERWFKAKMKNEI